jgi:tetratricopeptide (TPR) repeat protein
MGDITFCCPNCEQRLEAPIELGGVKVPCPSCQCELLVPAEADPPSVVSTPAPVTALVPAVLSPPPANQATQPSHFIAAKCPSCGGDLQVPDDRDQVKCMYCGGAVIIRQAVQLASGVSVPNLMALAKAAAAVGNHSEAYHYYTKVLEYDGRNSEAWSGKNVSNLMALAKVAALAQNHNEAYDYYTKVIECDPRNAGAWFGKGESAGRMSTVAQLMTQEMIVAFTNAINHAPDSDKGVWQRRCGESVTAVSAACYCMSRSHRDHGTWRHHIQNCRVLLAGLYSGLTFHRRNRAALELIICICADIVSDRVSYEPLFGSGCVTHEYEAELMARIDESAAQISAFDSSYVKPKNLTLRDLRGTARHLDPSQFR